MAFVRGRQTLLSAVAATGAGTTYSVENPRRTFQVTGTFVGTVAVQVSNDGTNWDTLISTTATGAWASDQPWPYVRGNVTAFTSGTITLIMSA